MLSDGNTGLFARAFVDERVAACFEDRALIAAMIAFEVALARAEAACDVIPANALLAIAAVRTEDLDCTAIAAASAADGNPAIEFVRRFVARVSRDDERAAGYVHWGATSQDVIDTAFVLQLRSALVRCDDGLGSIVAALSALAERYRATPVLGRTLLQPAIPIAFGVRAAGWLSAVKRARRRLRDAGAAAAVVQFGGAAGTLAALGSAGLAVTAALAEALDLDVPALPWHTQRDRFVDVAAALGIVAGTLGKIARDVSLAMQAELGELREPAAPGRGGSSAMPQKRNPVACAVMLANAARTPHLVATMFAAMPQEFERSLGGWHAEWTTLPQLAMLASGSIAACEPLLRELDVDTVAFARNLERTNGLAMAESVATGLGSTLGRVVAQREVGRVASAVATTGEDFFSALCHDAEISRHADAATLRKLMDPAAYLGSSDAFITRALAERDQ